MVAATFDRAPGTFAGYTTTTHFVKGPNPLLKWGTSFELWGPLTYTVLIDGKPVGQTQATNLAVPTPIPDGRAHLARGRHRPPRPGDGLQAAQPAHRRHRAEGIVQARRHAPARRRREGRRQATDASGTSAKASGIKSVSVNFGDRSKAVAARRASHSYRRAGKYTVRVTVTDGAGNATVLTRRITIKG